MPRIVDAVDPEVKKKENHGKVSILMGLIFKWEE